MERLVSTITDWTRLGLYEYLLVAYPDDAVIEKVTAEKQSFSEQYNKKIGGSAKPHITIAAFHAKEMMEETILRFMRRIFSVYPVFETALNNYSGFPPHTIYLRIQNQQPFRQLAAQLKTIGNYVQSCSCPPVKLESYPHLIVAPKLSEAVYLRAIAEYAHKSFHEKFSVRELVLLRRSNEYDSCKTIHVFPLKPSTSVSSTFLN